jgi:HD-GYP domain-containing protein (c-di-GMP phosphodiesterase class II)
MGTFDVEFMPIPISEFVKGITIPVDLYIRLGSEKFVLLGKAGTQSDINQLAKYQNKEVSYLWVYKREYYKIAHQAITMAGIAVSRKDLDDNIKTTIVTNAARSLYRQIDAIGMNVEAFNNAKMVSDAVIGLVETHKSFADLIASLKACSDHLLAHSIMVCSMSVMIGQALKYEKRATLEKLGLGGLLHDLGIKAIPQDILNKTTAGMTPDEVQHYETHPFKGMQMLQTLGVVPDDIISIVYEHHENSIGQGYPQRLRDIKIHPLAKVVGLADGFADLILPSVNNPVPKNTREALMYIEHTQGIPYNKEAFRALRKIIDAKSAALKKAA